MILKKQKEKIDYLINLKEKFLEEEISKDFETEKKRTKEFVDSFNKEAKKQNSEWYAKTEEHISICDSHSFILTHLCKKVKRGWWIFKISEIIELHISVRKNYTSFVENDYVITDRCIERNNKVFTYLPEIEPILEKIPQVFFILPKEEIYNYDKEIKRIEEKIEKLEQEIK